MSYDAGSTEKIFQEHNRATLALRGVRGNVATIILGIIVIIGFLSMNVYFLTKSESVPQEKKLEVESLEHTIPGMYCKKIQ